MLGYSASEVVGIRSIADFIDPAQIDERRSADRCHAARRSTRSTPSDGGRGPLDRPRRKNGEQEWRSCVVRVRTLSTLWPVWAPRFSRLAGAAWEVISGASAHGPGARGGYVVVATDVTQREQLAAERERDSMQREVTQALIEQNNRLRGSPR